MKTQAAPFYLFYFDRTANVHAKSKYGAMLLPESKIYNYFTSIRITNIDKALSRVLDYMKQKKVQYLDLNSFDQTFFK